MRTTQDFDFTVAYLVSCSLYVFTRLRKVSNMTKTIFSPSDAPWKPFWDARVILNKFACRPGIAVLDHVA